MNFDPNEIAIQYYFGKLDSWKLPGIAADALEFGYDGSTLRKLYQARRDRFRVHGDGGLFPNYEGPCKIDPCSKISEEGNSWQLQHF